jgi:hypothetical protein
VIYAAFELGNIEAELSQSRNQVAGRSGQGSDGMNRMDRQKGLLHRQEPHLSEPLPRSSYINLSLATRFKQMAILILPARVVAHFALF